MKAVPGSGYVRGYSSAWMSTRTTLARSRAWLAARLAAIEEMLAP